MVWRPTLLLRNLTFPAAGSYLLPHGAPKRAVLASAVMSDARLIYAESGLRSLPRLLSLLDRNPLAPTYGCFHRDYWLYKTSDFPDAVRQFGVHALALAYSHDLPGNVYRGNPNVRDWAIAGLLYWAKIQHADGSFDEFYPYERGWVGPTAFTTYANSEALRLLRAEMNPEAVARAETAIRRAAQFIARGEREEDHLANHHAMAVLALTTAADLLGDSAFDAAAADRFRIFRDQYHDPEGWSLEYDGADPGYLSATVSFLAKTYALLRRRSGEGAFPEPSSLGPAKKARGACELRTSDIRDVLAKTVEFCSYFVFPDGSYAGSIGSRNTLHFYPHGFELLARELPLAAAVADRMKEALAAGRLVPPEVMSDRYVHYRVPEYLLAALDAGKRPAILHQLPYERPPFTRVFHQAGIAAASHGRTYTVVNLAKGGVVRSVRRDGASSFVDTGWLGELSGGTILASQWIDPAYEITTSTTIWTVRGNLQIVPPPRLHTIGTHLLFRSVLALLGWNERTAHWLKGRIRKILILETRASDCAFERTIRLTDQGLAINDVLTNRGRLPFRRLLLGGDIPLRYVPQSRFFGAHELAVAPWEIGASDLRRLNAGEPLRVERVTPLS